MVSISRDMKKRVKYKICLDCGAKLPPEKKDICKLIISAIRTRPDLSYREIADAYHIHKVTVARYAAEAGIRRKKPRS